MAGGGGSARRQGDLAEVRPLRPGVPSTAEAAASSGDAPTRALAAVARRVLDTLDELLPRMGAAYRREVAEYAAMDDEEFGRVLSTSEAFVRLFAEALLDGVAQPLPDHAHLVGSGRRRQQAGISLDAAMHAFRIASRVGWTGIADASTDVAPAMVSDLAGRWIEYADRASTAFAEGHTTAASEQLRRLDARRQALLGDLLAADDEPAARAVAAGHGLQLAGRYVPALVATPQGEQLDDRLADALPPRSLLARRGEHLLALVPTTAEGDAAARLGAAAVAGVVAHGTAVAPGPALRAEVARLEAVLATALALGRTGVVAADDLAIARAVHEHEDLRRHLRAEVLEPLVAADGDGVFRETVRAYLDDGAIRAVADRLFVHANTVTYRLRRVRELTGLDPRVPAQAAPLVLALLLEELDAGGAGDGRPRPTTTTTTDEVQP